MRIKFETLDRRHGHHSWIIIVDGIESDCELIREKPTRWHGDGCSGIVVAMEEPWEYQLRDAHRALVSLEIPDGATAQIAKKTVVAYIKSNGLECLINPEG